MKYIALVVAIAFGCLVATPSCSKKSSSKPQQTCQLASAANTTPSGIVETYTFTYNNDEQISTVDLQIPGSSDLMRVFTYSGNTVYLAETLGGSLFSTDTAMVNSDGLMTSDSHFQVQGGYRNSSVYIYSGDQLKTAATLDAQGDTVDVVNYTWSGGNMVSVAETSGGFSFSATYTYNNKPAQAGDYWQLNQLTDPAPTIRNANMLTGLNSNGSVTNVSYSTDSTGKIIGLTETTGANVYNTTFQWTCH